MAFSGISNDWKNAASMSSNDWKSAGGQVEIRAVAARLARRGSFA
jgi:hypothetical protein